MAEESIDAINQPVASHGHGHKKKKPPPTPFAVKPITTFWFFLAFNLLSASYAPIQDCDETFNYWEPTHYLSHGYGLQTWEYSPEFAIRSWLYVLLHAVPGNIRRLMPFPTKIGEFYFIRYMLALACALAQTTLFRAINNNINPRVALFFLMAMIFSPGMFHASAAYLPSSFAMYTTMLGMAAFINWQGGLKTTVGVFWFALGAIVGWPFSVALAMPFVVEEIVLGIMGQQGAFVGALRRLIGGASTGLIVLALEFLTSSLFYRLPTLVPLNIVLYNIFAGEGRGPNIYGTEPWHFYIRNLLLNFNIWFLLAIATFPLVVFQKLLTSSQDVKKTGFRSFVFMAPFYLWLVVFSLQPHKEERFMYPAYPALALNAAMSLHICLTTFGTVRLPARIKLGIVALILGFSVLTGLARMYGIYEAYSAPLKVYNALQEDISVTSNDTLCLGKEWYRFPSSYFLPRGMHAKFIKSDFHGLLPGSFVGHEGFLSGTYTIPAGMNGENKEDVGKYVSLDTCTYLVDTHALSTTTSKNEPAYVLDVQGWDEVSCLPFLDAANTHVLSRTIWLPEHLSSRLFGGYFTRHWGRHCLLRQRRN